MKPLYLNLTKPALAEVSGAVEYVRANGGDAERFAARVAEAFGKAVASLTQEVADNENGKPFDQPDAAASIRFAKPVYRLRVETAKRKRGNSAGLWFAYYALINATGDADAKPDTMQVVAFRHSAAQPFDEAGGVGD